MSMDNQGKQSVRQLLQTTKARLVLQKAINLLSLIREWERLMYSRKYIEAINIKQAIHLAVADILGLLPLEEDTTAVEMYRLIDVEYENILAVEEECYVLEEYRISQIIKKINRKKNARKL